MPHPLVPMPVGTRYGRLRVVGYAGTEPSGARWLTVCDCGRAFTTVGSALRAGRTTSCGCLRTEMLRVRARGPGGRFIPLVG